MTEVDAVDAVFEVVVETAGDVRAALAARRSYREAENPSGDRQLAADVYADQLLEERLLAIDGVDSYASEERESVVTADESGVEASDRDGRNDDRGDSRGSDSRTVHVACDPLDGSSNLVSNNGMGTIVGVYEEPLPAGGDALLGAGYVLYGPITTMVVARDGTATEYLLDCDEAETLTDPVTLPDEPTVYGFGGRAPDWTPAFSSYVEAIEVDRLKLRYGGAMVADVNQVLAHGGIFGYPMLADRPEGKLRLQFEGLPMAAVVAAAGGASTDGERSLLTRTPDDLHERSPIFVGNASLVERLEETV